MDQTFPHGKGGPGLLGNLRCLCPAHNLYLAEQTYGRTFVHQKIHTHRTTVRRRV